MRKLVGTLAVLCATTLFAQTIGNYPLSTNSSTFNLPLPNTAIDLGSPATAAGTIGVAVLRFSANDCPGNAFKVKFFRGGGATYVMTEERGPFAVHGNLTTVNLVPPVTVQAGDFIGVTQLTECAAPVGKIPTADAKSMVQYDGDITGSTVGLTPNPISRYALAVYGSHAATDEIRTQVIIAAGAAAGAGGASFKTDVSIGNTRGEPAQGRLVYHPAGTSGTASDPSYEFSAVAYQRLTLPNFVATNLGLSGVGSIDVYTKVGAEPPQISARIYDDAGAAGTKGFTLDALPLDQTMGRFETAILFGPADAARYRMNLGIRTIEATDITFLHMHASGVQRAYLTKSYPANYFIQGLVRDFTGVNPDSGDQIIVYSNVKPYFAYGSIIDNTTNDPSVQVARALK